MFSIIAAAGWPIWPLIATSILACALVIERFLSLRRVYVLPNGLLEQAIHLVQQRGTYALFAQHSAASSPLGTILAAGIRFIYHHPESSRAQAKEILEEAGRIATHQLERYLSALGTIASIAPLMGLFGTVVGMIEIFSAQNSSLSANPTQLAQGISIALYNTGFGLFIAIPTLIFYRYFRARVTHYLIELETQASHFLDQSLSPPQK